MFFFVLMTIQLLKHDFSFPLKADMQVLIISLKLRRHVSIAVRFDFFEIFRLQVLAERLPLRPIFQNMTFVHYLLRLANLA